MDLLVLVLVISLVVLLLFFWLISISNDDSRFNRVIDKDKIPDNTVYSDIPVRPSGWVSNRPTYIVNSTSTADNSILPRIEQIQPHFFIPNEVDHFSNIYNEHQERQNEHQERQNEHQERQLDSAVDILNERINSVRTADFNRIYANVTSSSPFPPIVTTTIIQNENDLSQLTQTASGPLTNQLIEETMENMNNQYIYHNHSGIENLAQNFNEDIRKLRDDIIKLRDEELTKAKEISKSQNVFYNVEFNEANIDF